MCQGLCHRSASAVGLTDRRECTAIHDICACAEEVSKGGHEKPHSSIFLSACRIAGCSPAEAIHVGDSLRCDVAGAIGAGLQAAIWVNKTSDSTLVCDGAQFEITHISELEPLLRKALA